MASEFNVFTGIAASTKREIQIKNLDGQHSHRKQRHHRFCHRAEQLGQGSQVIPESAAAVVWLLGGVALLCCEAVRPRRRNV